MIFKNFILQLPSFIVQWIQATVSLKRLNNFLNGGEIDPHVIGKQPKDSSNAIEVSNGTFTWDDSFMIPTLNKISYTVPKGSNVAVVGQVGSGKSSVLSALIGRDVTAIKNNIKAREDRRLLYPLQCSPTIE